MYAQMFLRLSFKLLHTEIPPKTMENNSNSIATKT